MKKMLIALASIAAWAAAAPAQAESAAEFYKGKTVEYYTPGSAGGGYDTYLRTMIPYLEKETGAKFLPINEAGGGHLLAINKVFSAKQDGLSLVFADGEAALLGELFDLPGARYDLLKANWIARVNAETRMILFTPGSPYKTIQEAAKGDKLIKFGSTGKSDATSMASTTASEALGLKTKIVTGYKGSREFVRAAVQGEVDAISLSESSSARYAKGNKLRAVVALDHERSHFFPDVPTVFEAFKLDPAHAWWIDFQAAFAKVGRSVLTGPGVPADRVAYLRAVFKKVLADPELKAALEKRDAPITYAPAEDVAKYTHNVLGSLTPEKKKEVRHVMLEKYF